MGGDETNLVEWAENDPENPQNWPTSKKWIVTTVMSTLTFCVTFASSVFSSATEASAKEFGVSDEVMVLASSLFVLGFALGPTVWGPLSELYGRKIPLFTGFFISALFQIPVAVAQNVETVLICRFLGGVFGCSPIAVVGGALADFWDPVERGVAVCSFAGATFVGPLAGPIAGSFITASYLGWRWTEWLTLILMAFFGTVAVIVVPETSQPILLSRRAKKIRFETKNWAIHAAHDEQQVDIKAIVVKYLLRPLKMLVLEPILLLLTM
jgi:multidrug resistance protein